MTSRGTHATRRVGDAALPLYLGRCQNRDDYCQKRKYPTHSANGCKEKVRKTRAPARAGQAQLFLDDQPQYFDERMPLKGKNVASWS